MHCDICKVGESKYTLGCFVHVACTSCWKAYNEQNEDTILICPICFPEHDVMFIDRRQVDKTSTENHRKEPEDISVVSVGSSAEDLTGYNEEIEILLKDAEMTPEKFRRPDYRNYLNNACRNDHMVGTSALPHPTETAAINHPLEPGNSSGISTTYPATISDNGSRSNPIGSKDKVFKGMFLVDDVNAWMTEMPRDFIPENAGVRQEGSFDHHSPNISDVASGNSAESRMNDSNTSFHEHLALDHGDCPLHDLVDNVSLTSNDSRMLTEYGILSEDERTEPFKRPPDQHPSFDFEKDVMCNDKISMFRSTVSGAANPSPPQSLPGNSSGLLEDIASDHQFDHLPRPSPHSAEHKDNIHRLIMELEDLEELEAGSELPSTSRDMPIYGGRDTTGSDLSGAPYRAVNGTSSARSTERAQNVEHVHFGHIVNNEQISGNILPQDSDSTKGTKRKCSIEGPGFNDEENANRYFSDPSDNEQPNTSIEFDEFWDS